MPIKVYLIAILDNYMFQPLLAIFRLSSRQLKVLLYTLSVHVVQRSLYTGHIAYCNFYMRRCAMTRGMGMLVASVKFDGTGVVRRRVPRIV